MYFVYILISELKGSIYIGQTNNVENRFKKHNSGKVKSTSKFCPWSLLYFYKFETRRMAMRFEKYLKSLKNKKYIIDNITELKNKFISSE